MSRPSPVGARDLSIRITPRVQRGPKTDHADNKLRYFQIIAPDSQPATIPRNAVLTSTAGSTLCCLIPGGGGVGDPFERDPHAVREDVRDGLISVHAAREEYGVVLDPTTCEVDQYATEMLRRQCPTA